MVCLVKHSLDFVIGLEIFNTAILSRVIKFHLIANNLKCLSCVPKQGYTSLALVDAKAGRHFPTQFGKLGKLILLAVNWQFATIILFTTTWVRTLCTLTSEVKCPWHEIFYYLVWKSFQSDEERRLFCDSTLGCRVLQDFELCKLDNLQRQNRNTKWCKTTKYVIFVQILNLQGWNLAGLMYCNIYTFW